MMIYTRGKFVPTGFTPMALESVILIVNTDAGICHRHNVKRC